MLESSYRLYTGTAITTRPNDAGTVAYAIYDVVGSNNGTLGVIGTIPWIARGDNAYGYVTGARMAMNGTAGAGSNAYFRVHYYAIPPTAVVDNSPYAPQWGSVNNRLFYLDFNLQVQGVGANCAFDQQTELYRRFWTSNTRSIYYVIEARAVRLAPASEQYMVELSVERY